MKLINSMVLGVNTTKSHPERFVNGENSKIFVDALSGRLSSTNAKMLCAEVHENLYEAILKFATGSFVISEKGDSEVTFSDSANNYLYSVTNSKITGKNNYSIKVAEQFATELDGKTVYSNQKVAITKDTTHLVSVALLFGAMVLDFNKELTVLAKSCTKDLYEANSWSVDEVKEYNENIALPKLLLSKMSEYDFGDKDDFFPMFTAKLQKKSQKNKQLDFVFEVDEAGFYKPNSDYFFDSNCKGSNIKLPSKIKISETAKALYKRIVAEGSLKSFRNFILKGVAGTGKTQICYQLAFMLGINYYCFSFNANTEAGDLLGQILPVPQPDGSTEFQFVESPIIQWAKDSMGILEAQEFNTPRQSGAIVALNSALCEGRIYLSNGETVQISPNHIFIGTMNENYEGTKDLNQSFISRMDKVIRVDALTSKEMADRVKEYTNIPVPKLRAMGECIINLNKFIEKEDTLGVSSFREYMSWVQEVEFRAEGNIPSDEIIIEASIETVYNKIMQSDTSMMSIDEFKSTWLSPLRG